jgi:hypothetical protein
MDYANLSDSLMPVLPSWINSTLVGAKLGVQQQGQMLNSPGARAVVTNQQDVMSQGGSSIGGATRRRNP